MIKSGIYQILNIKNGKCYIGSAVNLRERLHLHRTCLRAGKHHSVKLQRSWDKNGPDVFTYQTIELVSDISQLIAREQYWIDEYEACGQNGYNMSPTAGSILGLTLPRSAVEKIIAFHTGRKRSAETCARIGAATRNRGPEVIAKIAAALRGKKRSPETNALFIGRKASPETRAKMSAAHMGKGIGRKHSKESIERTAAANRGRPLSVEHRIKISEGIKQYHKLRLQDE